MAEDKVQYCIEQLKYDVVAKIGQGTFGEVFKARDKSDNKFVALKRILMENETEGFPITALREMKFLKLLRHENVVNFIEMYQKKDESEDKSHFYLVLEFCEHDLAGLLSNVNVKFSLGEIKTVMKQLFSALFFLHSYQILHRDMKAANILITKTGVLKLADFGYARAISNQKNGQPNRYTNPVVTLWYRPPEILFGDRNYGPPVDMWGAGCIMAEMWTRTAIFQGKTDQQQLTIISQVCGSYSTDDWPGLENLSLFTKIELPQNHKRKVKEKLLPYVGDPSAVDLLDQLLVLNPDGRIDADQALSHDYFWTGPMPSDLGRMLSQLTESNFQYHQPQRHLHDDNYQDRVY